MNYSFQYSHFAFCVSALRHTQAVFCMSVSLFLTDISIPGTVSLGIQCKNLDYFHCLSIRHKKRTFSGMRQETQFEIPLQTTPSPNDQVKGEMAITVHCVRENQYLANA